MSALFKYFIFSFLVLHSNFLFASDVTDQVLFDTNQIIYNKNTGKITTDSNVNINYKDKKFNIDKLEYDATKSEIRSIGNIKSVDDNSFNTNNLVINTKTDSASLGALDMKFESDAFLKASSATIKNKEETSFNDIEYTACSQGLVKCPAPTWKLGASSISHNKKESTLTFKNVLFYMWNTPVFYLPFFKNHIDKSGNKSGFLIPKFGSSSYLGSVFQFPYLLKLNDYNDLTLTPMFTSERGDLLKAEYRTNYKYGTSITNASYKNKYKEDSRRWYIKTKNYFEIDDVWRGYANIEKVSDDTYLRLYNSSYDPWLLSKIGLEGSWQRSYFTIDVQSYQDLRNIPNEYVSQTFPIINYQNTTEPNDIGGYLKFNLHSANIIQDYASSIIKDERSFHTTALLRYNQPYINANGYMIDLGLEARTDIFLLKNILQNGNYYSGTKGQSSVSGDVTFKYPLYRKYKNKKEILEPTLQLIASPKYKRIPEIPNLDSKYTELSVENIFKNNRFSGYDLFESGTRLNYGINFIQNYNNNNTLEFFIGQNYNIDVPEDIYLKSSGLNNNRGFSNIVSSISYSPHEYLKLKYRPRINNETFKVDRHDLYLFTGSDIFNLTLNYVYLKDIVIEKDLSINRNEINTLISSQITKHWKIFAGDQYDLFIKNNIQFSTGLIYENDCFVFNINFVNNNARDRDYIGDKSVYFTLKFRTLGSISTNLGINQLEDND